eukprot:TRINITY_DN11230_c0_g1_i1.p4 TRINITY_DN11230_c0_g1~~TRINITY_DN11230_c0_g1_i1.p4  ORF type:complete len:106 (-),score=2.88 TRINITY_DN11230_c0_g1_i1:26-343(-)
MQGEGPTGLSLRYSLFCTFSTTPTWSLEKSAKSGEPAWKLKGEKQREEGYWPQTRKKLAAIRCFTSSLLTEKSAKRNYGRLGVPVYDRVFQADLYLGTKNHQGCL